MIFDGFMHQLPDSDPAETREWLESLDAVVDTHGKNRARYLLSALLDRARQLQVSFPATVSTPYVNSIPPEEEPWFPGDEHVERRIRAYLRWNAAVMVIRANKHADGIGGHLSTYASSAGLYEVGLNHFFRGKDDGQPGDHIYFQGHAAPGVYARAFLEGRLSEDDLDHFRTEIGRVGLSSYPAPPPDAGVLGVPDRLDGPRPDHGHLPRPLQPVPAQPPAGRHQRVSHLVLRGRRRVRRARDVRRAEPGQPGAARQPGLRRQLQPAAARRPGARQRQDHPGARGLLPGRGLERHQGHLGLPLGRAAAPGQGRRAAQQDEHHRRRRVPAVLGGVGGVHPRALLRARPAAAQAGRGHGPTRTSGGCRAAATTTASSTRPTSRPRTTSAAAHRPPSSARRSRAGHSAPRSRAATPPTRSRS